MSHLCNSKICRLCGEISQNGIKLFTSHERDVSQLINRYLPLKVSFATLVNVSQCTERQAIFESFINRDYIPSIIKILNVFAS